MGKKGGWFSAIKKAFTHSSNSKDNATDGPFSDKKINIEKRKKGKGILRNGENRSFIPLFREPSSIEEILGEADQLFIRPSPRILTTASSAPSPQRNPVRTYVPENPTPPPAKKSASSFSNSLPVNACSLRVNNNNNNNISPPKALPQKPAIASSPSTEADNSKFAIERESKKKVNEYPRGPEPTLRHRHLSATKIQSAFRGYLARRSFRALKGLVRLQGVVRGQSVRRQTENAMKQMQLLVRVETQIRSRRIQMLENQQRELLLRKNGKEIESPLSKWSTSQMPEMDDGNWDESVLTKEEADARLRKKVEAVIKRERAMAYAYSNQPWRANPNQHQAYPDTKSERFPRWWNWLERQLPQTTTTTITSTASHKKNNKNPFAFTPPRATSEHHNNNGIKKTNHANGYNKSEIQTPENREPLLTPRSSMSTRGRHFLRHTPSRTPPPPQAYNYSKPRGNNAPSKDDDSLVSSCPPFSSPSYMMATVSAKAKERSSSNPKKRFSFPLTPTWSGGNGKGSCGGGGGGGDNLRVLEKRDSPRSVGGASFDSTISMPAIVGRKPFNRFV